MGRTVCGDPSAREAGRGPTCPIQSSVRGGAGCLWRLAVSRQGRRLINVAVSVLLCLLPLPFHAVAQEPAGASPRIVIPFDFESSFDEGRYGRFVGDLIWKKLERRGGLVIPESMLDVREWCDRHNVRPNQQTSLARLKEIVVGGFGADIGICGKVERVQGFDFDVYDLWIKVVDFSGNQPEITFETKARTRTVSEIPHVYVKQALDKLYGRGPDAAAEIDQEAERRWQEGPNLVRGDFEKGATVPLGWDPLPEHVARVAAKRDNAARNHVIRFQFPENVAATTGVLYYSDYFPVEENATYRFQCRWRTTGSAAKVFIKCYDELPTGFRGNDRQTTAAASAKRAQARDRSGSELREVYRSQQNLQGPAKTWNLQTEDFTPQHTQYSPKWGRVMLYAYWPAGAVDWDDVIVKQIRPPVVSPSGKIRRPSLETKVLSDDLEEANRKSNPEP